MGLLNQGGAKKRKLTRHGSGQDRTLDAMAESVRKHNHDKHMERVLNAMRNDADLTANLVYLVDTGRFARKQGGKMSGMLPQSVNKWKIIKMNTKVSLVVEVWGSIVGDTNNVVVLQKKDKQFVNTMIRLGLHTELSSAVYSKNLNTLAEAMKKRYTEILSPLKGIKTKLKDPLDMNKYGVYRLEYNQKNFATAVVHQFSGVSVSLDDFGHEIDKTWALVNNGSVLKARMQKGKLSQQLYRLCSKDDTKAPDFMPEMLKRVPVSGLPPQTPSKTPGAALADEEEEEEDAGGAAEAAASSDGQGLVPLCAPAGEGNVPV